MLNFINTTTISKKQNLLNHKSNSDLMGAKGKFYLRDLLVKPMLIKMGGLVLVQVNHKKAIVNWKDHGWSVIKAWASACPCVVYE